MNLILDGGKATAEREGLVKLDGKYGIVAAILENCSCNLEDVDENLHKLD